MLSSPIVVSSSSFITLPSCSRVGSESEGGEDGRNAGEKFNVVEEEEEVDAGMPLVNSVL